MIKLSTYLSIAVTMCLAALPVVGQWAAPSASIIPEARGYVIIPDAALAPDKNKKYHAIYDASRAAPDPTQLLPAVNMAGLALNAFAASGVPSRNVRLAIIFRGATISGILNDASYRAKFGVANPNLSVLQGLKRAGVEVLVCGQTLVAEKVDPKTLATEVRVSSGAQFVLMSYQADGYALLVY
jgi:intracellular sulfur oxidation DsrE/DsrF family protein